MKKLIVILFVFALLTPMAEMYLQSYSGLKLKGDFITTPREKFSLANWLDGSYQKNQEVWLRSNFGFSNFFIRLYNEFIFKTFKKSPNNEIVLGKDNVAFLKSYINTMNGHDEVNEIALNEKYRKLKFLQDTLSKLNKYAYFIIAPNKARAMSEYIPEEYLQKNKISNYELTLKYLKKYKIQYIDFNSYFVDLSKRIPYPFLFPKYGTHWSTFISLKAADSIIRVMEYTQKVQLPRIGINQVLVSDSINAGDYDLGEIMNLITERAPGPPMAYALSEIKGKQNNFHGLIFSDSFYFNLQHNNFHDKVVKGSKFFFYFKELYGPDNEILNLNSIDLKVEIQNSDFLLFINTEINLYKAGFGAIEEFYDLYKNGKDLLKNSNFDRLKELELLIQRIKNSPEWLSQIEEKAAKRRTSVDSMIAIDARYILDEMREGAKK